LATGQGLFDLWCSSPDTPASDKSLIDTWAAKLGLQCWYTWVNDPGNQKMEQQTFTIAPSAFDVTLLPPTARTPTTPAFREAIGAFLQQQFQGIGGSVSIFVDDERWLSLGVPTRHRRSRWK
jgi:hypothetical protein